MMLAGPWARSRRVSMWWSDAAGSRLMDRWLFSASQTWRRSFYNNVPGNIDVPHPGGGRAGRIG